MSKDTKWYKAKCHVRYPPTKVILKACSVFVTAAAHPSVSVSFCLLCVEQISGGNLKFCIIKGPR